MGLRAPQAGGSEVPDAGKVLPHICDAGDSPTAQPCPVPPDPPEMLGHPLALPVPPQNPSSRGTPIWQPQSEATCSHLSVLGESWGG